MTGLMDLPVKVRKNKNNKRAVRNLYRKKLVNNHMAVQIDYIAGSGYKKSLFVKITDWILTKFFGVK